MENNNDLLLVLANSDSAQLVAFLPIYGDRLLHHSNQIWSIGSVFIPLSLSGIAFGISDSTRTFAIGLFSILLIWLWYVISVNLRKLIDQTWSICGAIESTLLKIDPPRNKSGLDEFLPIKSLSYLRIVRLFIPIIISIGWIGMIILSQCLISMK